MKKRILAAAVAFCMLLGFAALLPADVFGEWEITAHAETSGDFVYMQYSNGACYIEKYNGSATTLTIPEKLGGKTVSGIDHNAFCYNSTLKSVTIGSNIIDIGSYAFYCCYALESVTFKGKTNLGSGAFADCMELKKVTFASGQQGISRDAFEDTPWLTEKLKSDGIVVVNGVLIAVDCELESVTIPSGVTRIAEDAFYGSKVRTLTVPDSVAAMDENVFKNCSALEKVVFGKGVKRLGIYLFRNCPKLKRIEIPQSVTQIEGGFAIECPALTEVVISSANKNYYLSGSCVCEKNKDGDILRYVLPNAVDIVIPEGVRSAGEFCCPDSTGLKSVTFPKSFSFGSEYLLNRLDSRGYFVRRSGVTFRCYKWTDPERCALAFGLDYVLLDKSELHNTQGKTLVKLDEKLFRLLDYSDCSFCLAASAEQNGIYLFRGKKLYLISAADGKASVVWDLSGSVAEVLDTFENSGRLYVLAGRTVGDTEKSSIFTFDLTQKKQVGKLDLSAFYSHICADGQGRIFTSESEIIYLLGSDGKVLGSVSVGRDIYRLTGFDEAKSCVYYEYTNGWNYSQAVKVQGSKLTVCKSPVISVDRYSNKDAQIIGGKYIAASSGYNMRVYDASKLNLNSSDDDDYDDNNPLIDFERDENEFSESDVNEYSWGARTVWYSRDSSIISYANGSKLVEYNVNGIKTFEYDTCGHVFALMTLGKKVVAVIEQDTQNFYLEISDWKKPASVNVTGTAKTMLTGGTLQLKASIEGLFRTQIKWKSSDTKVAAVDQSGKVYATGAGTVTVTASTPNGAKGTYKITVSQNGALTDPVLKTNGKGTSVCNTWFDSADIINSYIYEDENRRIWKAENQYDRVFVQCYTAELKQTVSAKYIKMPNGIFGGLYFGKKYNFIVTGTQNDQYSETVENLRVTRYDRQWNVIDYVVFKNYNVAVPFFFGSCALTEKNDGLYIHTCRKMYPGEDGIGHQSSINFAVKIVNNKMTINTTSMVGNYVSHSLDQLSATDGDYVYLFDEGDCYPPAVTICACNVKDGTSKYGETFGYPQDKDYDTGDLDMGGVAVHCDNVLIAYSKLQSGNENYINDIWVTSTDKETLKNTKRVKISNYAANGTRTAINPKLVKVSAELSALLWEEYDNSTEKSQVRACLIDSQGNLCSKIGALSGRLSDCQPVLCRDGCIRWYATGENSVPVFYCVQPFELSNIHQHTYKQDQNVPATCTNDGLKTQKCTVCGKTHTKVIKAAGHSWSQWTVSEQASVGTHGTLTRKCSKCGEQESGSYVYYQRLAGSNRFETAAKISAQSYKAAQTVVLAYGLDSADALAGVPLAKAMNAPILLTNKNELPQETLAEIKRLGAKNVVILGGEGAIGAQVEKTLAENGLATERISGKSRFETAAEINKRLAQISGRKTFDVFFVYAFNAADALSVSSVAAIGSSPIVYLKTTGELDDVTKAYLESIKGSVGKAYVIGGIGVISDEMSNAAGNALGVVPTRIAGSNRYETCIAVNNKFADCFKGDSVCAAKGLDFPDALAGGAFAALKGSPLLLADGKLSDAQAAYLSGKKPKQIFVFGGTGAVPNLLTAQIAMAAV